MQILADDLSRYELLTPEKKEFVLEEVEGHSMFQIPLPLEDGRPDGTVSDDTSNLSVQESESLQNCAKYRTDYLSSQTPKPEVIKKKLKKPRALKTFRINSFCVK